MGTNSDREKIQSNITEMLRERWASTSLLLLPFEIDALTASTEQLLLILQNASSFSFAFFSRLFAFLTNVMRSSEIRRHLRLKFSNLSKRSRQFFLGKMRIAEVPNNRRTNLRLFDD